MDQWLAKLLIALSDGQLDNVEMADLIGSASLIQIILIVAIVYTLKRNRKRKK